jgi:hypothetical protein
MPGVINDANWYADECDPHRGGEDDATKEILVSQYRSANRQQNKIKNPAS